MSQRKMGDGLFTVGSVLIVALIALVLVVVHINQPRPESWQSVMRRESGIVNGQAMPLYFVDSFKKTKVDGPALLVRHQDGVLYSSEIEVQYVSPSGDRTKLDVKTFRLKFNAASSPEPTARLRLLAWDASRSTASNFDAFLDSVTVNQSDLDFYRSLAGLD